MNQIVIYEYGYDYTKAKYGDNAKICYTDTDSFAFHVKYENAYVGYVEDVETSFNASNYEVERYPRIKTKKVIGLMT